MSPTIKTAPAATPSNLPSLRHHDHRVERLIDRLPTRMQTTVRWLRRPSSRWVRVPAGVLLVGGGFLSILPLLGLWMLPLGLMLLAEDMPALRRARDCILERIERHRPHWFTGKEEVSESKASAPPPPSSDSYNS